MKIEIMDYAVVLRMLTMTIVWLLLLIGFLQGGSTMVTAVRGQDLRPNARAL